jgi:glycosyltransferase involved in cell wall biosynthesis
MMTSKIAYVVKGFPRLSESFIANEVRWLSRLGMDIEVFSVKRGDGLEEPESGRRVEYLPAVSSLTATTLGRWLAANVGPFSRSQTYLLVRRPLGYLRTLAFAWRCAFRYRDRDRRGLKKTFVKEFLQATFIAHRVLARGEFRHVHAHFCHGATTIAWMVAMLSGLPFSFTAHAKDIYERSQNPEGLLERKIAAARFVVTCTHTNREHLSSIAASAEHIHAVYHGLDLTMFAPAQRVEQHERPKLLSVGRFVAKKGFRYLVEACAELRDRGLEFELDIVGEPGEESATIAELVESLRLHDRVRLLPPVPQAELAALYRSAAAFVLPCVVVESGDRDGIPNVMAEAMASGLPVVVSEVSGIPELVETEVNGLLVPPRSSAGLAAALERVIGDPTLRQRLGRAARERITAVFDAAKTHEQLADIFARGLHEHAIAAP